MTMTMVLMKMNPYPLAPLVVGIIPAMEWNSVLCMGILSTRTAGVQIKLYQ